MDGEKAMTMVRKLEPWSEFSSEAKQVISYPRHGEIHVAADPEGRHWCLQKGPGVATSKIALSKLTDLGRKWHLDQRAQEREFAAKKAQARAAHFAANSEVDVDGDARSGAHEHDDGEGSERGVPGGGLMEAVDAEREQDGGTCTASAPDADNEAMSVTE